MTHKNPNSSRNAGGVVGGLTLVLESVAELQAGAEAIESLAGAASSLAQRVDHAAQRPHPAALAQGPRRCGIRNEVCLCSRRRGGRMRKRER